MSEVLLIKIVFGFIYGLGLLFMIFKIWGPKD